MHIFSAEGVESLLQALSVSM